MAGSFIPGLGTAAGAALGGAAGGAAGGLIDHSGTMGTLLGAAGGGLGGYMGAGGGLSALAGSEAADTVATGAAADSAAAGNPFGAPAMQGPTQSGMPLQTAMSAEGPTSTGEPLGSALAGGAKSTGGSPSASPTNAQLYKTGMSAGLGASVGSLLSPPQEPKNDKSAAFGKPMPPLNPNFNAMLGNHNSSTFSMNGYNPYSVAQGQGYNFYSPNGNGT